MAQMGSFVPAQSAKLPIVDRIFTRIGASDNLARGRSTFMVEMIETAVILNSATPKSLVILDEIGRGTATFDGLSIAWSVVEHLHRQNKTKTLFATHYHELTGLTKLLSGVKNYHVSVQEVGKEIIFLKRVEPGSANKSYGIEVARLAGLPQLVIQRAREILFEQEKSDREVTKHPNSSYQQKTNDCQERNSSTNNNQKILKEIQEVNLNQLTPLKALEFLDQLKKKI